MSEPPVEPTRDGCPASEKGSVSHLIAQAKEGDETALAELHARYWPKLVSIARRRLNGAPLRDRDPEDVAQSAFIAFYTSLKAERLPELANRHQLLALLSHIVACKAANEIKRGLTQKQGGGQVVNATTLTVLADGGDHTPLQEAILNDCYEFYINALCESLREFAELHLAGFTNREIAERLDCVERTVERKIALMRMRWREIASESIYKDVSDLLGK